MAAAGGPERCWRLPRLPSRARDAHKGSCGRVLVVGGAPGLTGAVWLAGRAALTSTAAVVTLGVPAPLAAGFQARATSTMTLALPAGEEGGLGPGAAAEIQAKESSLDALVLGPGMGRAASTAALVQALLERLSVPLVIDADALRLIAAGALELSHLPQPAILTPHPGEMAGLLGTTIGAVQQDRRQAALDFARTHRVVLVLKGDRTVVTDGERLYVNHSGNPGMATAGAGDVLAGLVGALRSRQLEGFEAAALGVYLHGLAGDLAARGAGPEGLCADDLLAQVPVAVQRYREANP